MPRNHPPEPGWLPRFQAAQTPEARLAAAYDAVRAAARRLERKRRTGLRGNRYAAEAEQLGRARADEFRDQVALAMVNLAHKAAYADWEITWASGHRGRPNPHAVR